VRSGLPSTRSTPGLCATLRHDTGTFVDDGHEPSRTGHRQSRTFMATAYTIYAEERSLPS
jgi:hypothetical protein